MSQSDLSDNQLIDFENEMAGIVDEGFFGEDSPAALSPSRRRSLSRRPSGSLSASPSRSTSVRDSSFVADMLEEETDEDTGATEVDELLVRGGSPSRRSSLARSSGGSSAFDFSGTSPRLSQRRLSSPRLSQRRSASPILSRRTGSRAASPLMRRTSRQSLSSNGLYPTPVVQRVSDVRRPVSPVLARTSRVGSPVRRTTRRAPAKKTTKRKVSTRKKKSPSPKRKVSTRKKKSPSPKRKVSTRKKTSAKKTSTRKRNSKSKSPKKKSAPKKKKSPVKLWWDSFSKEEKAGIKSLTGEGKYADIYNKGNFGDDRRAKNSPGKSVSGTADAWWAKLTPKQQTGAKALYRGYNRQSIYDAFSSKFAVKVPAKGEVKFLTGCKKRQSLTDKNREYCSCVIQSTANNIFAKPTEIKNRIATCKKNLPGGVTPACGTCINLRGLTDVGLEAYIKALGFSPFGSGGKRLTRPELFELAKDIRDKAAKKYPKKKTSAKRKSRSPVRKSPKKKAPAKRKTKSRSPARKSPKKKVSTRRKKSASPRRSPRKKSPVKKAPVSSKAKKKVSTRKKAASPKKKAASPKKKAASPKKKTSAKKKVSTKKKSTPKKKAGFVLNPKTNRLVKVGGATWKKLVEEGAIKK